MSKLPGRFWKKTCPSTDVRFSAAVLENSRSRRGTRSPPKQFFTRWARHRSKERGCIGGGYSLGPKRTAPYALAVASTMAAWQAAITIGHRAAILMQQPDSPEAKRMVTEKIIAGGKGFIGAQGELAKLAVKAQLGEGIVRALATISAAGSTLLMLHFLRCLIRIAPDRTKEEETRRQQKEPLIRLVEHRGAGRQH